MVTDAEGSHTASLLAYDAVADLAILTVDRPAPMPGLRLAKTAPAEGEAVYVAGMGGHPELYRAMSAPVVGVIPQGPWDRSAMYLAIDGDTRREDRGGPVVNAGGELVGIVSTSFYHDAPGVPEKATLASYAQRLAGLLARCGV